MQKIETNYLPPVMLEKDAHYLIILDERALSVEEQTAFKAWLVENPLHREAFAQTASVWGKMDVLHGLAEIFPIEKTAAAEKRVKTSSCGSLAVWKWPLAAGWLLEGGLV